MRYFLTQRQPPLDRLLLIESGSRLLLENQIALIRATWGADIPIDLLTCYAGMPKGLPPGTKVYRVADYVSRQSRKELIRELRSRRYSFAGMICSAEPIMTKWKWLVAIRLPAKLFIVNENGDYFWVHRQNAAAIREFVLVRLGLSGWGAIRTIGRLVIFPFSVLFLVLYAFAAHTRRLLRLWFNQKSYETHPDLPSRRP